jgi:hypothetical protein
VPRNKQKPVNATIHKRVHMTLRTDLLVNVMASLMGSDYTSTMEAAILYGLAYLNEKNNLNLNYWTNEVKLPTLKDVDDLLMPPV